MNQESTDIKQNIGDAERAVSNREIEINWELENIELWRLRNLPCQFLKTPYRIEYFQIDHLFEELPPLFIDQSMLDLIELVSNGISIIPPVLKIEYNRANGVLERILSNNKSGLFLCDGNHRLQLAKALGLTTAPALVFENKDIGNIKFLSEPFQIKECDKVEIYRFNIGDSSPYENYQKWNYQSKAIRTNNSEGIYGLANGEHCLSMVFHVLRENISGVYKGELVILRLNVDKREIKFSNNNEYCFFAGNIIEKLTIDEFINRVYPKYSLVLDFYRIAMNFPNEVTKTNFTSLLDKIGAYHANIRFNLARMAGREIVFA